MQTLLNPVRILTVIACLIMLGTAACGSPPGGTESDPGPTQPAATPAPVEEDSAPPAQQPSGPVPVGDWCEAWTASGEAWAVFSRVVYLREDPIEEVEAAAQTAKARLDDLLATSPPQYRADMQIYRDKFIELTDALIETYRDGSTDLPEPDEELQEKLERMNVVAVEECGPE